MSNAASFWKWRRPNLNTNRRPETPAPVTNTAAEALCSIFGDDEISDVKLQGSDGGTVVAVKALLASRSPMFRQKFFGHQHQLQQTEPRTPASKSTSKSSSKSISIPEEDEPNDSNQDSESVSVADSTNDIDKPKKQNQKDIVVFKEWDCRILHLVVEYCYTDTCSVFKGQPTEDISRIMANLRIASKAFKLPGLLDKVQQWTWRQISRHPAICPAMIDEGMKKDDICEIALQTLQLKARASLLPDQHSVGSGVLALSKPGLLFALRTMEDTTSHLLLLQALEQWVDFSSEDCDGGSPLRERASREAFARKCAMRFIKLSKIPQANLSSVTKRSNLLTSHKSDASNTSTLSMLDTGHHFSPKSTNILISHDNGDTNTSPLSLLDGRLSPRPVSSLSSSRPRPLNTRSFSTSQCQ